ncbi:MAG: nuclear transport factor 2 family protein [Verrucomicrobia bacterium]|nr:nuclear transport factor 2 family protein [Verrucomicrobiota bacterium]
MVKLAHVQTSPRMDGCATPEQWPRLFEHYFNAGDLDAVIALYEPEAHLVTQPGNIIIGHEAIRSVLRAMIDAKTRLHSRVVRAVTAGDIAQLYTDFEGTMVDSSKKMVPIRNKAVEVLRRQPDGHWKLIIGDPNARE